MLNGFFIICFESANQIRKAQAEIEIKNETKIYSYTRQNKKDFEFGRSPFTIKYIIWTIVNIYEKLFE